MIRNYFKIAWRNLLKNKVTASINILGLAIGISTCLIIFSLTRFELSYESFRHDTENVYRLTSRFKNEAGDFNFNGGVSAPIPPVMVNELKGIENSTFFRTYWAKAKVPDATNPKFFPQPSFGINARTDMIICRSSYFDFFKSDWLAGSPNTSLSEPNKVVLTESKMLKYFGNIDPKNAIGKQIIYEDSLQTSVSGIVKDQPLNTDFSFNDFISYASIENPRFADDFNFDQWTNTNSGDQFFVKLNKNYTKEAFEAQIPVFLAKHLDTSDKWFSMRTLVLQKLDQMHYDTNYSNDYNRVINPKVIYILMAVSFFVLFMAIINFINLQTAQAVSRAKEMGIRKVLGSFRISLIMQIFTEAFIMVLFATVLSLIIIQPTFIYFKDFFPNTFVFDFTSFDFILILGFVILTTSFLSGVYPAFLISKLSPTETLKSHLNKNRNNGSGLLRKYLIVFQFSIAQTFIMGTFMVVLQSKYMLNKDLGINKNAIQFFNLSWDIDRSKKNILADELAKLSDIKLLSLSEVPAREGYSTSRISYMNDEKEFTVQSHEKCIDPNYIKLFGLKLLAGKNISKSDTVREFLVNESFARAIGFSKPEEAVGKLLDYYDSHGTKTKFPIVGVLKDFNFQSLHNKIEPIFLRSRPQNARNISFLSTSIEKNHREVLQSQINAIYKKIFPNEMAMPEIGFYSKVFEQFYETETRLAKLLNTVTGIAILISCMGLFGLVVFATQQRAKEIGIRKVLGASVANILTLITKDFFVLILLAIVISSPIAYYLINKWLQNFAFSIDLKLWYFVLGGFITCLIALATLSFEAAKVALLNPVDSLKSE
ncbi:ABC transporter permease [Lacihabitans sp. LS3-19]|uniref:ABC transporter permease n=1 Tax=Lacihabitans sp. LS3-19 TaxID=2487335 RepID=UPI0020CE2120|nr:ABC transporter permease [Lacihabitans sp. LS3-19]MCP9766520.1 ABC transporter permease [Lacihabitans sp. LS3-19]